MSRTKRKYPPYYNRVNIILSKNAEWYKVEDNELKEWVEWLCIWDVIRPKKYKCLTPQQYIDKIKAKFTFDNHRKDNAPSWYRRDRNKKARHNEKRIIFNAVKYNKEVIMHPPKKDANWLFW